MGNNTSKVTRDNREITKYNYSDEESTTSFLTEKPLAYKASTTLKSKPFELASLNSWESELLSDDKNLLAINALGNHSIPDIIRNNKVLAKDSVDIWNVQVDVEGSPVTSQNASGRCWLFASTNVFRTFYQKKYNLEKFELSQAYLFFYDKLEKSNYLLTNIIETAEDLDLDSRVVQAIFANGLSDGGQWDMVVNLVTKYGLVPKTVYKDNFSASNSGALNYVLVNKLREYSLVLRNLIKDGASKDEVFATKDAQLKEVYNILGLTLGVPPKATDEIVWDYKDKSNKVHTLKTTPKDFAKLVDLKIEETFSLINDPRNEYNKLYTVDRLNNVVGGKPIDYVNVSAKVLKEAVVTSLKNNEPVFFGSDVGKFSAGDLGVLDTKAFNYELAFNTKLNLSKADRLRVGSSAMTHAMVITAVHIVDGEIQRYRIENSWGESAGNKGYYVATDAWFEEYVYQVVTNTKYAPKELTEIWKSGDYTVLPIYDPMGALA